MRMRIQNSLMAKASRIRNGSSVFESILHRSVWNARAAVTPISKLNDVVGVSLLRPMQMRPIPSHHNCFIISSRSYHSTASSLFPVRRRRNRTALPTEAEEDDDIRADVWSSAETGDETGQDSPLQRRKQPIDYLCAPEVFNTVAGALMEKLFGALHPLQALNDRMLLTRGIEEDVGPFILVDLGPADGQYNIQMDFENQILVLQSPISGQKYYRLREPPSSQNSNNSEWICVDDGHNFEGLLVRDLIRQVQGVPNL